MNEFLATIRSQRWDDHRLYHHSRINQSLHLLSAISFLAGYAMLFFDPAKAALLAWCVSMVSRQAGHFFFEPRGYDTLNKVSDAHKEAVKVGYNIRRKIVLMAVSGATPLVLWLEPSLWGFIEPASGPREFLHDVGIAWLVLGAAALLLRVGQLWAKDGAVTGLAWGTKVLTDPFHDVMLYRRAPIHLMRGQLIDPMLDVQPR